MAKQPFPFPPDPVIEPFLLNGQTICNGLNFTLTTTLGEIDLLGEIMACGGYENLLSYHAHKHFCGKQQRLDSLRLD